MPSSIRIIPAIRGRDAQGAGYFGASRGARTHNGVDFVAGIGTTVVALTAGRVTKIGYPYADRPRIRYVEVTDDRGYRVRYFYIEPSVTLGQQVDVGTRLGTVQALPYEGITPHYHFEVMAPGTAREYVDPLKYLAGDV